MEENKESKVIDQKKYLQKYLKSEKKGKKKKIKKVKTSDARVKVIDDDIDFGQLMPVDESCIDIYGEDAPQIAGVIDERPLDVQLSEKFIFDSSRWKVVTEDDCLNSNLVIEKQNRQNDEPEILEDKDTELIDSDNDVPRRRRNSDSDNDLPRRSKPDTEVCRRNDSDSDIEVPRKIKQEHDSDNDDLPRRKRKDTFKAPTVVTERPRKKSRWKDTDDDSDIKPEIKKEPTVVSFNIRNPDKAAKQEKEAVRKAQLEKYDRWGKGLKQVEDRAQKLQEDVHEMQKPLARYADDADLENYLKEQERDGDPMLEYLRQQRTEERGEDESVKDRSSKPQYNGAFMPNRFGIAPGHRWDGVDRSNGYEQSWIQAKNSRKVVEEDAYKWSTDDM